jgi:hypothetical protein
MRINLISRFPYMALNSSLFLGMILSIHRSSNKCNIVQFFLSIRVRRIFDEHSFIEHTWLRVCK